MDELKIGDEVIIIASSNNGCDFSASKKKAIVTSLRTNNSGTKLYTVNCEGTNHTQCFFLREALQLINKKTFMTKISIMMKKLLDADTQALVKAGYINGDLKLTPEGNEALQVINFMEKKADLVAMAQEKIKEEESVK